MFAGRGTYQETKFDEDADKVVEYYRDQGYISARVGEPELKVVSDSDDKKTRWIELRIPITEGHRYRVGDFDFDGNTVVKTDDLRPLFKVKQGEFYSEKAIRKGSRRRARSTAPAATSSSPASPTTSSATIPNPAEPQTPAALDGRSPERRAGPPIVDVTMRLQEGKQFFVNRITFTGNTTTRDNVIRREMRLVEDGVFNTEALKYSIKRLNQLGYFKPLEGGKDVDVQKTPNENNKVDVKLKLEEQNRNQLTFGAGVSEFEGFFGQLSFQTVELPRPRREPHAVDAGRLAGAELLSSRSPSRSCSTATSPAASTCSRRDVRYIGQFTQKSTGGVAHASGSRSAGFTRMFTNYSYERVRVTEINDVYTDPLVLARNPFLRDSLLIGQGGERMISKVVPSFVHNTVDQPIFPTTGKRYTLSIDLAGLGGNTNFYKPMLEGVWFLQAEQPDVARLPRPVRVHPHRSAGRRSCRSSRSCSSAASTASAASTSAPSARRIR